MSQSTWERFARYYLAAAQQHKKEWEWLEPNLPQIRRAWKFASQKVRDPELIIAYGEFLWDLYDTTTGHLYKELFAVRQQYESGSTDLSLRQVFLRLDEIMRSQWLIRSVLETSVSASGARSVASAIIVNSTVITGDNVVIQKERESDDQDVVG